MGLIPDKQGSKLGSTYFEVTDIQKNFRPLHKDATSVWVHSIPAVTTVGLDGQPHQIRSYATEMCVSTSRSGVGCRPCTTKDPLWDKLDQKSKTNRKGLRHDFGKKMVHLLPVLNLTTGKAELLKGGNQLYEGMTVWLTSQPEAGQDLRRCEWGAWKTGKNMQTKYTTTRMDATPFTITPELEAEAKSVLERGIADMTPMTAEAFAAAITGGEDLPVETPALPAPAPAPQGLTASNTAAPGHTPVQHAPAPAPAAPPVPPAGSDVLTGFSAWLQAQSEFSGAGMFDHLIPILQKHTGGVNYHACTPEQLTTLKAALSAKLDELRAKKA